MKALEKNKGDKMPDISKLSPLELKVARLAQLGVKRNGIATALGVSVNTVKTIIQRITHKLGREWQAMTLFPDDKDNTLYPPLHDEGFDAYSLTPLNVHTKNRRAALFLLIANNRPGISVVRLSGAQRFFLRPIINFLANQKYLRLLNVDWHDVYQPEWLPIVNRGRRLVRAANYTTNDSRYILNCFYNYLQNDLEEHIEQLGTYLTKVASVNNLMPQQRLPTLDFLKEEARRAFG